MTIQHKIKFEKDSLVITQIVDPQTSKPSEPIASGNVLPASFAQAAVAPQIAVPSQQSNTPGKPILKGGGPGDDLPGTGPGLFGTASPITIIGPIIFGCPIPGPETNSTDTQSDQQKAKD